MYGVSDSTVDALGAAILDADHGLPSWMTFTRGAGSWSRQTAAAVDGTTFITTGTSENTARFDYGGGRTMLLIEPTRANVIPVSNFVDAGTNNVPDGWAINAGAAGTDFECVAGGPHGGLKFRIMDTAVVSRGCYYDNANVDYGVVAVSGWYRRTGTAGAASVDSVHGGAGGSWGTLSLGTALCDWTLFQGTKDTTGGVGMDYVGMFYAATGTDPPGVVECALPQAETGDCATSYIPTTAGAVTRAAELCAVDPGRVGATAGYVSFLWRPDYASTTALTVSPVLFQWAPNWELYFDPADDKLKLTVDSAAGAESAALTFARQGLLHVGVRYGSFGTRLYVDGVETTDASAWGAPALAPYLGSRAASANCRPAAYGNFLSTAV